MLKTALLENFKHFLWKKLFFKTFKNMLQPWWMCHLEQIIRIKTFRLFQQILIFRVIPNPPRMQYCFFRLSSEHVLSESSYEFPQSMLFSAEDILYLAEREALCIYDSYAWRSGNRDWTRTQNQRKDLSSVRIIQVSKWGRRGLCYMLLVMAEIICFKTSHTHF